MSERIEEKTSLPTSVDLGWKPTEEECDTIQTIIIEDIQEGLEERRKTLPRIGEGFDAEEPVLGKTYR